MNSLRTIPNRLINEKSPYLLQHAYNPVDWYPWGDEAFERARNEEKPIFLSIGYSTCYWCHVMEREVFENEDIADLMNRYVVSIKVDREERPDVDRVYMSALQAMIGSGGWPMSIFLTPDLRPFFGATYIPPTAQHGRPGFREILEEIHHVWSTDRKQIEEAGGRVGDYLAQLSNPGTEPAEAGEQALHAGFESFSRSYDQINAGFGSAPKFPRPVTFNFLFRYHGRTGKRQALEMSLETLRRMAKGGMHDHIGGGFHRYATDGGWHVPHFEKMLYDQAQLAVSYLEAYQITHDAFFAEIARGILGYVTRVMTHPEGGFYSAEDAESLPDREGQSEASDSHQPQRKEEGAFYVWTKKAIDRILSPEEARIFCRSFGVEENGNVTSDPHAVFRGKNVLHVVTAPEDLAKQLDLPVKQVSALLESSRRKIFDAREKRPHCHLDDKVLTSWNGLMISAFARASQVLEDHRYLTLAERAARFILDNLRDKTTRRLLRRYRDGEARFDGQLDDYAFFIQGMIDLYEASFSVKWLTAALELTEEQDRIFCDNDRGGFYDTPGQDKSILIRTKEWYDGAEPSGNSIAILNLLRLFHLANNQEHEARAKRSLAFFGERLLTSPQATPQFLVALDFSLAKPKQIIIAGKPDAQDTAMLLREVQTRFIPNKVLMLADGDEGQRELASRIPFLETLKMIDGKATAFVCENYACRLPTGDPAVLARLLGG
jgi:uncharacterized protein YyaL (SSP411 family)